MRVDQVTRLRTGEFENNEPRVMLKEVFAASIELMSLEDNDFSWASWGNAPTAVAELQSHLDSLAQPGRPDIKGISLLFAPFGPM